MIAYDNTYWNNKGKFQAIADALQKMIPISGEVADAKNNPALEKFRRAMNCYYDLYNNGLCNRGREFPKVFGFAASQYKFRDGRYGYDYTQRMYDLTEEAFDQIVLAAAAEQLTK